MDRLRQQESSRVADTFHVAMALLGAKAYVDVLTLWQDVVPTSARVDSTGATFYSQALRKVRIRRHQVQAIVVPFMRLFMALQTGSTFQRPGSAGAAPDTLQTLRQDFDTVLRKYAPDALGGAEIPDRDPFDGVDETTVIKTPEGRSYTAWGLDDWTDDADLDLDEIKKLDEMLEQEEADAEAEAQRVLDELGAKYLKEKLRKQAEAQAADEADEAAREAEQAKAGRRVAAHAERMVQNGGRHVRSTVGAANKRVIGFVRVHHPEHDITPCGFCALLISRGIWQIYASKRSAALTGSQFDDYHAGCHCTVEEVYSREYFDSDPRFNVNREMRHIYENPEEYLGEGETWDFSYSDGKNQMTKWRKYFRSRAAQAAAKQRSTLARRER